ncbi:MAG TPA: histidinol-phosphatase HisJ [Nitrospinota bacterium]|nr:histidinol-phosphatase HisJ [Nitrospinota bacterium]
MIDYHIHTIFCGHATGDFEDYVQKAIDLGFKEIGFADHFPLLRHWEPEITMLSEELPVYVGKVLEINNRFKEIEIKLGIEVDYIPECIEETQKILEKYPFDYVYCSLHYIGDWGFDNPAYKESWEKENITEIYQEYYRLLREAVSTGLFDIIAHLDLVKKFGYRPEKNIFHEIKRVINTIKKEKMAIEINTSGLRMPVSEIYPSQEILRYCKKRFVPVIMGSDAHTPDDVGRDFNKAKRILKKIGYKNTVVFNKRKIVDKIKL